MQEDLYILFVVSIAGGSDCFGSCSYLTGATPVAYPSSPRGRSLAWEHLSSNTSTRTADHSTLVDTTPGHYAMSTL